MDAPIAELNRYEELKNEVTFYENKIKGAGLHSLKVISALALLVVLGSCFFNVIIEREMFQEWIATFRWKNLLFHLGFWTLIYYFIRVQKSYHYLKNKKKELHNLLQDKPRLAKMAT